MNINEERFEMVEQMSTIKLGVKLADQAVRLARDILVDSPEDVQLNPLVQPKEIFMLAHFWEVPDEVIAACLLFGLVGHSQPIDKNLVATHTNLRVAEILSRTQKITKRFNTKRSVTNMRPFAMLAAESDVDVLFTVVAGLIFNNMALVDGLDTMAGDDPATRQYLRDAIMSTSLNRSHPHNQGLMKALDQFDHPIKTQWLAQLA